MDGRLKIKVGDRLGDNSVNWKINREQGRSAQTLNDEE